MDGEWGGGERRANHEDVNIILSLKVYEFIFKFPPLKTVFLVFASSFPALIYSTIAINKLFPSKFTLKKMNTL